MITPIRPRSTGRRLLVGCCALAVMSLPLACGRAEERSLCRAYDDFTAAREAIAAVDLDTTSTSEAADIAENYLATINSLRATSDDRFRLAIDTLYLYVADVLRTLNSAPDDADYATWAPLVDDSIEDAQQAADVVVALINPQCNPDID